MFVPTSDLLYLLIDARDPSTLTGHIVMLASLDSPVMKPTLQL